MAHSNGVKSALSGVFIAAAVCAAAPAMALDAGKCYSAEQVRNETWNAEGGSKQFTLLQGDRTTVTRPKNFFTSTRDGSLGYNLEKADDGQLCVGRKYTNVQVNVTNSRPSWLRLPKGSDNEKYISTQERDGARVVLTARSIVNVDGKDYLGSQIIVTKNDNLIEGFNGGAAILNNSNGKGDLLVSMMDVKTNPDLAKFADMNSGKRP